MATYLNIYGDVYLTQFLFLNDDEFLLVVYRADASIKFTKE